MKALFWLIGICFIIYLLSLLLKPQLATWIYADDIDVELYGDASISELKIRFTAEEIQEDTLLVFSNGEQLVSDLNYIGYNYFIVDYKDTRAVFNQFKESKISAHDYRFLISVQGDSVEFDLRINGPYAAN